MLLYYGEIALKSSLLLTFINASVLCFELHRSKSTVNSTAAISKQRSYDNESSNNLPNIRINDSQLDTNILIVPILNPLLIIQLNGQPTNLINFNSSGISKNFSLQLGYKSGYESVPHYKKIKNKDKNSSNIDYKETNFISALNKFMDMFGGSNIFGNDITKISFNDALLEETKNRYNFLDKISDFIKNQQIHKQNASKKI